MKRILTGLALAAGLFMAGSQAQAQFVLVKSVVGNGGTPMSSSQFSVNSTVGQAVIGPVSNSSNWAGQGFWYEVNKVGAVPGVTYAIDGNVLEQNFPNPAKGATMIKFILARRSDIELKIFSMPGQEIATLATGMHEAGEHEVRLADPKLPSGTYFYQLQVGPHVLRRQMVLVQ